MDECVIAHAVDTAQQLNVAMTIHDQRQVPVKTRGGRNRPTMHVSTWGRGKGWNSQRRCALSGRRGTLPSTSHKKDYVNFSPQATHRSEIRRPTVQVQHPGPRPHSYTTPLAIMSFNSRSISRPLFDA